MKTEKHCSVIDAEGRHVTYVLVKIRDKPLEDGGTEKEAEWDNSAYSLSGDITDHRDGTVTIKMGKPTDLEDAYEMLMGGDEA